MTSIIICSIDDAKFHAVSQMYTRLFQGHSCEIIRIADARSLAEGFNRGFGLSTGEHVIFSHDDIEILSPKLASIVASRLAEYDLIGVAGVTRLVNARIFTAGPPDSFGQVAYSLPNGGFAVYIMSHARRVFGNIKAMDGLFLAMRRNVVQTIGFDQVLFDGFHLYDTDFTLRAHLAGFRLAVCCDIMVIHHSRGTYDAAWGHYAARFTQKYAAQIEKPVHSRYQWCNVEVPDRQSVIDVMTSPAWDGQ